MVNDPLKKKDISTTGLGSTSIGREDLSTEDINLPSTGATPTTGTTPGGQGVVGKAKDAMKGLSPEEVRQKAKDAVGKNVAAAAGAMEGYAQQTDPSVMREAGKKLGEHAKVVKDEVIPQRAPKTTYEDIGTTGAEPGRMATAKESLKSGASTLKESTMSGLQTGRERAKSGMGTYRESIKDKSPEEVREMTKQATGKVTAAGTGSVEGFAQQADPQVFREAVTKTKETVKEGAKGVKESVKGSTSTSETDYSSTGSNI